MARRATVLLTIITSALVLTSCSGSGRDSNQDNGQDSDTASRSQPASSATASQRGAGSGTSGLVLTDVRTTRTEGHDRVVLVFAGGGTPGWQAGYVDAPVLDGSGEPVSLGGTAVLDVYAADTTWPAEDYYDGPSRIRAPDPGAVAEVYVVGTFEGTTQVLVGTDGPLPFRVSTRTDPTRLIVDVGTNP